MLDYQIVTDDTGKVLAVLSYCTLTLAQEIARQYARVLGIRTCRNTVRASVAPQVGARLPEYSRAVEA